jgi:type IV secretion system protein VirB5
MENGDNDNQNSATNNDIKEKSGGDNGKHSNAITSDKAYQRAYEEWAKRIGSAKLQARNWRLACLLSLVVMVILLICILAQISTQKRYVYVAELKPQDNVVNVRPMSVKYQPEQAQYEAFIARFLNKVMAIPLDPVVLRNNWKEAYQFVTGKAQKRLTKLAKKMQPFDKVGKLTRTVKVVNINAASDNSFEVTWYVKTINKQGKTKNSNLYSGIFTFVKNKQPEKMEKLLINPLGLQIGYFSVKQKGSSE